MSRAISGGILRHAMRLLLEGALVILPLGAVVLLVIGIVHRLQDAADPLAGRFLHPLVGALLLLLLLCALVGALVRSRPGGWARARLEGMVLHQIPGYRLARALLATELPGTESGQRPQPALAQIEEALCPALLMDRFADGRVLVFVPGTPAPMSGALYILDADRVRPLDTPLMPFLKAISSWGLGLRALVEAQERPASPIPQPCPSEPGPADPAPADPGLAPPRAGAAAD